MSKAAVVRLPSEGVCRQKEAFLPARKKPLKKVLTFFVIDVN